MPVCGVHVITDTGKKKTVVIIYIIYIDYLLFINMALATGWDFE